MEQHWEKVAELLVDCVDVHSSEAGLVLKVHIVAVGEVGNCFADVKVAEQKDKSGADLHEQEVDLREQEVDLQEQKVGLQEQ